MNVQTAFKDRAQDALADTQLQATLKYAAPGFIGKRAKARTALPEFDALRDAARDMKNRVLNDLAGHLEAYEAAAAAKGAQVHWAETADDARRMVLDICRQADAKLIAKGKSMISEEIHINAALEDAGFEVIETDLGEYIIQLRGETPSHIIAPAVHLDKSQVEEAFRAAHPHLPAARDLSARETLVAEARTVLREKFLAADVGITGANLLVAETGESVIVTNEGNGDLTQTCAKVHIVLASLEKIVPTLDDAALVLRLLGRSATGQEMSVYTTFSGGPRRAEDPDGPERYHVILLDNGRTNMLGSELQEMLRCIRCGACINHCPVYGAIGGHAYGAVYPGPMGSVLSPALMGLKQHRPMPNASTFCGRCQDVCPMRIPLPDMMRAHREREFDGRMTPKVGRWALRGWAALARRPWIYRIWARVAARGLRWMRAARIGDGRAPALSAWTQDRDFPAPTGETFMAQWRKHGRRGAK